MPVPAVRTIYGYGKIKSREATIDPDDKSSEPCWDDLSPDQEVWAVMQWYRFADGHQENGDICFLRPECTEEHVRKRMEQMEQSSSGTREEALALLQCYEASEDDYAYVEEKYPNYQSEPDPKETDNYDVYHARLKVMCDLQPKTVELIKIANATKDPVKRQFVEREAVQSYFAELPGTLRAGGFGPQQQGSASCLRETRPDETPVIGRLREEGSMKLRWFNF